MKAPKTKATPPVKECAASKALRGKCTKRTKLSATLWHLMRGKCHRFHAERFGDHCLHSTVSTLQQQYGIEIEREWVTVPNRFGTQTRVKLYTVHSASRRRARLLLRRNRL